MSSVVAAPGVIEHRAGPDVIQLGELAGTRLSGCDRTQRAAYALMHQLIPELFELDEYGNAREIGDGRVPPGQEEKAYLAKSNCPEFAIEVIEE